MNPDPIASATLALLYIGQGHRRKAKQVVREALARHPDDGAALVLLERLRTRSDADVSCTVSGNAIEVKWRSVEMPAHVVVVYVTPSGDPHVTSVPCDQPFGSWRLPRRGSAGAVAVCVGRVEPDEGFVPLAVAGECTWC